MERITLSRLRIWNVAPRFYGNRWVLAFATFRDLEPACSGTWWERNYAIRDAMYSNPLPWGAT